MGYNATYGLPLNDSLTRYDESKGNQLSFLESDICGNLLVKQEYGHCANCGESLAGQMAYVHGTEELCKKCETKHRINLRKNNYKKKAVKK